MCRTIDSVIVAYGKGRLKCFLADPNTVLDLVSPIQILSLKSLSKKKKKSLNHKSNQKSTSKQFISY